MSGRPNRMSMALTGQIEHVLEAELAIADGYQAHDECVIRTALYGIRAGVADLEDIQTDVLYARRVLTVGRADAMDRRLQARERDVLRTQLQYVQNGKEKPRLRLTGVAGKSNRRR